MSTVDTKNPKTGQTRVRVFKALLPITSSSPANGLTHKEIKKICGLPEKSGTLGVILTKEVEAGNLKKGHKDSDFLVKGRGNSRHLFAYVLTAKGRKEFLAGKVGSGRGRKVGQPWTEAMRAAILPAICSA